MMNKGIKTIQETNLSHAWRKAFLEAAKPGVKEISPLIVSIVGLIDERPAEDCLVRQMLDDELVNKGFFTCKTVAETIFPLSLWNPIQDRHQLFERYKHILPDIKKLTPQNHNGLYFERLIAFGPKRKEINQLDHIIMTYHNGNHRRSALQAAIFDPARDHTDQRQRGFPCLQQLAFIPGEDSELTVTAFYATQYLFDRAYGNYLGLCQLGRFMAHELGLRLIQVTCIAGVAKIGNVTKNDIKDFVRRLEGNERLMPI
jgi:hypothetical protein